MTLSPRTPTRTSSWRRPLSSSSSRSYAEFVRRTSTFSSKIPPEPPRPVSTQSKPEVAAKTTTTTSGSSMMSKQMSMPARKPREVLVVPDDKLEVQDDVPDADELDQRVEAFLKNFREQMRLQRQESLQRHRSRSLVDS